MPTRSFLLCVLAAVLTLAPAFAALPAAATGGKGGGPVSVLVILGNGGTGTLALDATVAKTLADHGFAVQVVSDREPLTLEFMQQFNSVVVVGLEDFNGGGYYGVGGLSLLNTARTVSLLPQYVEAGGGVVFVPIMAGAGSQVSDTLDAALAPWKIRIGWETVRDDANQFADKALDNYFWTRAIAAHPVTEGVKAVAYPGQLMRWDDAYPVNPLYLGDPAWTAVVRGEATSQSVRNVNHKWAVADAGKAPALAAVREAGKGRVAVIGLGGFYLLTHAFYNEIDKRTNKPIENLGEATTGFLNGIAYAKGDGKTASDWGTLFENILRWEAQASAAAGIGGPPAPWQTKLARMEYPADQIPPAAVVDWKTQGTPPTWAHRLPNFLWWRGNAFYDEMPDPLVVHPQRMCKLLIGAHSAYSDGKGSVADWAKAAKAAGYQAVIFTERFENVDGTQWARFIEECKANSSPEFACLQGLDITDTQGNHYLILGNNNFPTGGMLSPDGKQLEMTARLSLGFSGHIAVMHRMGNNATLPKELFRHFQGVTVYTYAPNKKGKFGLADDALTAYQWQLNNASNPVPIVVHELYRPADVKKKGAMGFQQIAPAQDAQDAIRYFRYGMDHFFENPQRYYISEGPVITGWSIFNKDIGTADLNRDHWRATVGAAAGDAKATITEATLYDRGLVARHWTPNAPSFTDTLDGEHGMQHYYMLVVTDSKGRKAITPHLRTVERGFYTRCGDRQNWFGAAGSYTGIWPSGTHGINFIMPDVPAGAETETFFAKVNPLASKMSLPFASNAMTFTDFTIDCKYIRPTQYGMDAWRIENAIPTTTYHAVGRVGKWHDIETGLANGNLKTLTTVDATLTLKKALAPVEGIFPVINTCYWQASTYRYVKDGAPVTGKLDGKATTLIDLPAGASVGGYFLLTPMTVSGNGKLGWRATPGKEVPAGTTFAASYIYLPDAWRAELGAEGTTPWSMQLTQGSATALGTVNLTAANGGVAGTLTAGGALKMLPLKVSGLNVNWPVALWTSNNDTYHAFWGGLGGGEKPLNEKTTSGPPFLAPIGVCNGIGYAALPNANARFYVGNTLVADNAAVALSYALWTATEARIQVHNPTNAPITTRVTSAPIPGKFAVDVTVTVPAGSSTALALPVK